MENKFIVQHRNDNIVVNCRSLKPILEGWDLNGIEFGVMAPDGLKGIGLESRDMNSGICNGKLRDVFKETGYPRVELSDETPTYDYTEEIRSLESKCNKLNECINVNTVPRNINELLLLNASDVEKLLNYLIDLLKDHTSRNFILFVENVKHLLNFIRINDSDVDAKTIKWHINVLIDNFTKIYNEFPIEVSCCFGKAEPSFHSPIINEIFRRLKHTITDDFESINPKERKQTLKHIFMDLFSWYFAELSEQKKDKEKIDHIKSLKKEIDIKKRYNNTISVLGEYHHETRSIVLYYKNIEKADKYHKEMLMKVVYLHELVHAILDPVNKKDRYWYVDKIEEPIAEYGMLCLCAWIGPLEVSLDYALNHVKAKQQCLPICHYGLGYYLYKRERLDFDGDCPEYILSEFLNHKKNLAIRGSSKLDRFADKFKQVFLGMESYPREHQATLYELLMSGYRGQDY